MSPDHSIDSAQWQIMLEKAKANRRVYSLPQAGGGMGTAEVFTPGNATDMFAVHTLIEHPESYRGSGEAQAIIRFGSLFDQLRGIHVGNEYLWQPEVQKTRGLVDLSSQPFGTAAAETSLQLTEHALQILRGTAKYDDPQFRGRYRVLAEKGYQQLDAAANAMGLSDKFERKPLEIWRAGQPATEITYGSDYSSIERVALNAKRVHLKGDSDGSISLVLEGLSPELLAAIAGQDVLICDPAHASGSSVIGILLAAHAVGAAPKSVELRSLAAVRSGLELTQQIHSTLDVPFRAGVLNVGVFLTDQFYIGGEDKKRVLHYPIVADAGDALCGTKKASC